MGESTAKKAQEIGHESLQILDKKIDELITKNEANERSLMLMGISINGFGIYIALEAIKFAIEKGINVDLSYLKYSVLFFFLSILLILISSVIGIKANSKFIDDLLKLNKRKDVEEFKKINYNKFIKLIIWIQIVGLLSFTISATLLAICIFQFC